MAADKWQGVKDHESRPLKDLFTSGDARVEQMTIEQSGIRFDFAKTHLDDALLKEMTALCDKSGFAEKRKALFDGDIVNVSEGRSAEHTAERGSGHPDSVAQAKGLQGRMRALVEAIEAGAFGEVKHLLHIGIGGSALGPKLAIDALGREDAQIDVRIISNVDAAALAEAVRDIDPAKTMIAIASKTFTTTETLMNAQSALDWLRDHDVGDPHGRCVALTAHPEKALEWGIDESRILPFSESVGGRYSIWCAIGFPMALGLGWAAFEEMLEGAAEMDRHFNSASPLENAPMMAAFADQYYVQARGCETRAIFAYDERLRLLPDYLQQLEMESNGKSVTSDGAPLSGHSAAISWGGVGTDAQHAVFQLLHQGTRLVPVEFIVSKTPGHDFDPAHHESLMINCFAQGAALMAGQSHDDPARNYAGDRPSVTLLIDDVTPAILGALIAFYEHRTFTNAMLLGINPFDQFGVELGKQMARHMGEKGPSGFDASTMALIAAAEF